MMNDPRGSIWRKWDLHVHTPSSSDYEDQSITNDIIIEKLQQADISAVAITDHHLIDVNRILELQRLANNAITIFPGIEFRSELGGSESVHFVGIFPDTFGRRELDAVWTKLAGKLNLTGQDIEQRGQDRVYCDFKDSADLIHELGGIVSVHAGRKANSIENIRNTEKFKEALKEDLAHDCINILEVNRADDVQSYKEVVFPDIGFELPIICCSDNHNISEYSFDIPCWIKADPTFEGLKQIIYEPEARVRIQKEDPSESETYAKIGIANIQLPSDLKIKDELGEVTEFCIRGNYDLPFSNNLTCIIGGRGSGKSTIAHLIYNSQNQEAEKLRDIDSPLINLVLSPSPLKVVADKTDCEIPTQTEFFFQNEIERAAKNVEQMSDLIRRRLERLSSIQGESVEVKGAVWNKSAGDFDVLIDAYDQIAYLNSKILSTENSIKILIKQTQVITSDEYKSYLDEIDVLMCAVNSFVIYEQEYALLAKRISALKITIDTLEWNENQGKNVLIKLKSKLEECERELSERYIASKKAYIAEGAKTNLDKEKELLTNYLKTKGLAPENVQELANANQEINELRQRITRLNLEKQPFLNIYQEKTQIIKDYDSAYHYYRNALSGAASLLYTTLSNLQSTQKEITFDVIADETELKRQICDFVKRMLKDETILRADVIERVIFANGNSQEYAAESNKIREQVNQSTVAEKHTEILKELINDDVFLERLHLRVVKYYFDINNLRVQTKLGGTLLKNTSFGERCGIAIAIILAAGTNPVLIDQLEDHLDGKFISTILVPLIRKQKHNRQIILITRDANVVIGGDAELIHILEVLNERTEVVPSTIENIEYRDKYIWILDGGKEAFLKREQKYAFSGTTS